jgi:hypothetical protein
MKKTSALTITGKSKQQVIRAIEKRLIALKKMERQLGLVQPPIRNRPLEHPLRPVHRG